MRIRAPRGDTLPRAQVAAIGVITGVLSLVVVDVVTSGMALLAAGILTFVIAVVVLAIVATAVTTFTEPLQRFTDRVFGDEENDRVTGEAGIDGRDGDGRGGDGRGGDGRDGDGRGAGRGSLG